VWGNTTADLPAHAPSQFADVLTGSTITVDRGRVEIGRVLSTLPVAVLLGST
jgi:maltooligosyltrehalose synthase